jgi:hypothetical protein
MYWLGDRPGNMSHNRLILLKSTDNYRYGWTTIPHLYITKGTEPWNIHISPAFFKKHT